MKSSVQLEFKIYSKIHNRTFISRQIKSRLFQSMRDVAINAIKLDILPLNVDLSQKDK